MIVKDLIKKLQALKNQDAVVVVTTDNFEQGNNQIPASRVSEFKGDMVSETFVDAFDGDSYDKDIARYNKKGKTNFVKIN